MKQSKVLWAKSLTFSLLAMAAVFLLLYALTGNFFRSILGMALIYLTNKLFKRSNALAFMAMQHQAREVMEDKS